MSEYIIINAEAIQKKIEELEWSLNNIPESYIPKHEAQIYALKQLLSQSTLLIHEIEKAYDAGKLNEELSNTFDNPKGRYISNLKFDI